MANQKLSAATLLSPVSATDRLIVASGAQDRYTTPKQLLDYVEAAFFPSIPTGEILHYSPVQALSALAFSPVVGSYYAVPFRARPGDTINGIAIEITTAPTVDGNVRVGLYANDPLTRKPVATAGLIYDSGNIAFTTTSFAFSTTPVKIALPVAQTVPDDGTLWVILQSDTASSMQWRRAGANYGTNLLPRTIAAGSLTTTNADAGLGVTGSFGAMPSNPPALAQAASVPAIALYRA